MADAKDILSGIPKTGFPSSQEKRPKPQKESQRKPDGVSREVYALTGGIPPMIPTIDVSQHKRKAPSDKEKISWQWLPFTSSARADTFKLFHWAKVINGVLPSGDYPFAKYNKRVNIVKYTNEEYKKHLVDPNWTKEETDQLFDLCEQFDLRFIVVADRFTTNRSAEELKNRYNSVSRALVQAKAPSSADVNGHPFVKDPEIERKRAQLITTSQHKQLGRKDYEAEARKIAESRVNDKVVDEAGLPQSSNTADFDRTAEKAEALVDFESHSDLDICGHLEPAADTTTLIPASLRMLRVYLRSHALDQMVQAVSSSSGLRTIKRVEQTLQDLGVPEKPRVPTKAVCAEYLQLRKEILMLLNLQKELQNKETEAVSTRDNSYADVASTPGTPKRSHRGDQPFGHDSSGLTGDRVGKREQKKKALGRYPDDPPSPPQSKRARKLRISDE